MCEALREIAKYTPDVSNRHSYLKTLHINSSMVGCHRFSKQWKLAGELSTWHPWDSEEEEEDGCIMSPASCIVHNMAPTMTNGDEEGSRQAMQERFIPSLRGCLCKSHALENDSFLRVAKLLSIDLPPWPVTVRNKTLAMAF